MSNRNKKRVSHTQREEQQGKKVMWVFTIIAVILIILMWVLYSVWA